MKRRDAVRALRNLGFEQQPQRGGSHEKWICHRDGRPWIVTLDCHDGEVSAKNVKSMIAQAGVSKRQWYEAADL
jgi:predicted RNA binding protein YcfA (HicA-like mRNA interferase family)